MSRQSWQQGPRAACHAGLVHATSVENTSLSLLRAKFICRCVLSAGKANMRVFSYEYTRLDGGVRCCNLCHLVWVDVCVPERPDISPSTLLSYRCVQLLIAPSPAFISVPATFSQLKMRKKNFFLFPVYR